jgi:hypothetical protein
MMRDSSAYSERPAGVKSQPAVLVISKLDS